jgi:hypothetical protein
MLLLSCAAQRVAPQLPSWPPELARFRPSPEKYKDPYVAIRDG